ncbi:hypothetical protein ACU686_42665 [Yinghuangia aomiensis]
MTLRAGTSADEAELIAFVRDRIAKFKHPTGSSSATCPKPRPARSRRPCCAHAAGPLGTEPWHRENT